MKTECYIDITAPRWGKEEKEYQNIPSKLSWAYGTKSSNALMHKVKHLRLRWWTYGPGGRYLVRLSSPRITAVTNCGRYIFLDSKYGALCEMPRPNTVICAACEGKGRNFPKGKKHEITLQEARVRLGCENIQ